MTKYMYSDSSAAHYRESCIYFSHIPRKRVITIKIYGHTTTGTGSCNNTYTAFMLTQWHGLVRLGLVRPIVAAVHTMHSHSLHSPICVSDNYNINHCPY